MAEAQQTETDNILADVLAAQSELAGEQGGEEKGGGAQEQAPPRTEETAEQTAQRERDELGRFKAKGEETPDKPTEEKTRETLKVKDPAVQAGAERQIAEKGQITNPDTLAPPGPWRGAAKIDYARLPESIRSEIRTQWDEIEKGRGEFAPLQQAIAPYRDSWVQAAGSVENALHQFGAFWNAYLTNPRGLIDHIARTRGIDLGQPAGQQPENGGTPQTPDINSVVAQAVQQAIAPIQQRFQQTEQQKIVSEIEAFRADPAHPYFNDVAEQMVLRINAARAAGQRLSLQDAYDHEVWANPAIRERLISQRTEEAKKNQAAEVERANKARAASLRGSPLPGGASGTTGQGSSVLDDVRAAAAEIAGA